MALVTEGGYDLQALGCVDSIRRSSHALAQPQHASHVAGDGRPRSVASTRAAARAVRRCVKRAIAPFWKVK